MQAQAISKANALLQGKCPKCRQGDIFKHPLSRLSKFTQMHENCPHCGVHFEPEPGFFQGAMYVSYAFTIAVLVTCSILLYALGNFSEWVYIATIITVMVLIVPINYRYSRILFLHFFGGIKFDATQR